MLVRLLSLQIAALLVSPMAVNAESVSLSGKTYAVVNEVEDDEYSLRLSVACGQLPVVVLFGYQSPTDHYRLAGSHAGWQLDRVVKGTVTRLGSSEVPGATAQVQIDLRRHRHRLHVVIDGTLALTTLDSTFAAGKVLLSSGNEVLDSQYQPLGELYFSDDFMRAQESSSNLGDWEVASGTWKLHSVMELVRKNPDARIRDGREPEAERSPNPFSVGGADEEGALLVTGHPFWDDYRLETSVKPQGAVGIAFARSEADTYYLFRWDPPSQFPKPGTAELVRVSAGEEQVLGARSVIGRRGDWYRLAAECVAGRIRCEIDGAPVFDVTEPACAGGRVGLYARGDAESRFDDVLVQGVEEIRLDETDLQAARASASMRTLGDPKWETGSLSAAVRLPNGAREAGLAFGVTTDSRWACVLTRSGKCELRRVRGGEREVLASAPIKPRGSSPILLHLELTDPQTVACYADDVLELRYRGEVPQRGAYGLVGDETAQFADVRLFADRARDWEQQEVRNEIFADDPYMQGWAAPRWAWTHQPDAGNLGGTTYLHEGDFYGAMEVSLPCTMASTVFCGTDTASASQGYALQIKRGAEQESRLVLQRKGASVAETTVKAEADAELTLAREGKYVWVKLDDEEILTFRDAAPLHGRRVGIVAEDAPNFREVSVRRDHVIDYLFERAPVDWSSVGTWEVTNRFACDPRWSTLCGRSTGLAALWSKFEFEGDFTLEYYGGMRMQQGELLKGSALPYTRVGDLNVSFGAESEDVFSGYSLLLSAWDPFWTEKWNKLLRRGKVIAKNDRELIPRTREHEPAVRQVLLEWLPGGRAVHGAWYFLKIRRTGNEVRLYFDNELALTCRDDDPLLGKRLALWTQDNAIVIARAKLCYERKRRSTAHVLPSVAPPLTPKPPKVLPTLVITSRTHPSGHFDFQGGTQGWQPAKGDQSAEVTLARRGPHDTCLKLTNGFLGGDFGVAPPVSSVDLQRVPKIDFDYRVDPHAKINLYFKLSGESHRTFFVRLTGNAASTEVMTEVADARVTADGKWHHVSLDLAEALLQLDPSRRSLRISSLQFGNFHEGYLNAGLGGNPAGATYYLDNVTWTAVGAGEVDFSLGTLGGEPVESYRWSVDRSPAGLPPGGPGANVAVVDDKQRLSLRGTRPHSVATVKAEGLAPGTWYLHAVAKNSGGHWLPPAHFPLRVGAELEPVAVHPPDGGKWGGEPISIRFDGDPAAHLALSGNRLTMNGKSVSLTEDTAQYDRASKKLTLDVRSAKQVLADGSEVKLVLTYDDNTSARRSNSTYAWQYTMDYEADCSPPTGIRLSNRLVDDDFETTKGRWTTYGDEHGATLTRDPTTAASGKYSLKLVNRIAGGASGATVYPSSFKIGHYPILSFDYRTNEHFRADLCYHASSPQRGIKFTDRATSMTLTGEVPNVVTDGRWHHAEVNLKKLIDGASGDYSRSKYSAEKLILADFGHVGNVPGVTMHIDNFELTPAVSTTNGLSLSWTATDLSGIAGYSYHWSNSPNDEADTVSEGEEGKGVFTDLPEGRQFFHLRAQDGAGNWSATKHYRFLVDNTPPKLTSTTPADGEGSAAETLKVQFDDAIAGVDPSGFSLTVGGRRCYLTSTYTKFDGARGALSYDWVRHRRDMTEPLADGTEIEVSLQKITDLVGNASEDISWKWRIDYAKDKRGPIAPNIRCGTQRNLVSDSFADSLGGWERYSATGATLSRHFDEERQDYCLKLTNDNLGGRASAYIRKDAFTPKTYPIVNFDYRFPPGIELALLMYSTTEKRYFSLGLTAECKLYQSAGVAPGIVADGRWHHAQFNLHELLQKGMPEVADDSIRYLIIGDWGRNDNVAGMTYYIDNFFLTAMGSAAPSFTWRAVDATGIAEHSYVLDRSPLTEADTEPEGTEAKAQLPELREPGQWFFHVRVRDGAGNWGRTAHYPYYWSGA